VPPETFPHKRVHRKIEGAPAGISESSYLGLHLRALVWADGIGELDRMAASLEDALISVWRQALVENARTVKLDEGSYPVRRTSRTKVREVDFKFGDAALRGVEQNPGTSSRWAKLAREGKQAMQFLANGRYVANVVDGKVTMYRSTRKPER
jgi:hypothetical protein